MVQSQKEIVKNKVKVSYGWLADEEIYAAYDIALNDYLTIRYPSSNNRPTAETFEVDNYIGSLLYVRVLDILSRGGGLNVSAYRENGVNITYGGSYIEPQWVAMIMPKASVPK